MKPHPDEFLEWMTPQEVGNLAGGFTAQFIRLEIKAGIIPATLVISKRGRLGRYRIRKTDAQAYVAQLHGSPRAT
jgi:hypothetical protein